jgi:type II secretory pathway pseudopilin PulG
MKIMKIHKRKFARAVTLTEVMAAIAILIISSTGALSYQYYSAKDAKKARSQINATRVAQLLLEDWKSTGGSKEYNPQTLGLGFTSALEVPAHYSNGAGVGLGSPLHDSVHEVEIDDITLVVMLTWADVAEDDVSGVILRQLDVTVTEEEAWQGNSEKKLQELNPVILTTYVRVDAAGG